MFKSPFRRSRRKPFAIGCAVVVLAAATSAIFDFEAFDFETNAQAAVACRQPTQTQLVTPYSDLFPTGSCFTRYGARLNQAQPVYSGFSLYGPSPKSTIIGTASNTAVVVCQASTFFSPVPGKTKWMLTLGQKTGSTTNVWGWIPTSSIQSDGTTFVSGVPLCKKRPSPPAGNYRTPFPTITLDTSAAPEFATWLADAALTVKAWYPYLVDQLAGSNYAPPTAFTIRVDPTFDGIAEAGGTEMRLASKWFINRPDDIGILIHEVAHIIQGYPKNDPSWIVEGIADYARDYLYVDRLPTKITTVSKLEDAYGTSAGMLLYAQKTYDPDLVLMLNVLMHRGTYTEKFWTDTTGKSYAELWKEFQNRSVRSVLV